LEAPTPVCKDNSLGNSRVKDQVNIQVNIQVKDQVNIQVNFKVKGEDQCLDSEAR
jgi:hypothetical protein